MTPRFFQRPIVLALLPLLAACAAPRPVQEVPPLPPAPPASAQEPAPPHVTDNDRSIVYKGTGVVVRGEQPGGALPPSPPPPRGPSGGPVVLNFEGADLREVVRNILGDILNASYTIDPNVGGQVTIRTTGGIPREALPATLETLLRMNGATMVYEGNLWKILPQSAAMQIGRAHV